MSCVTLLPLRWSEMKKCEEAKNALEEIPALGRLQREIGALPLTRKLDNTSMSYNSLRKLWLFGSKTPAAFTMTCCLYLLSNLTTLSYSLISCHCGYEIIFFKYEILCICLYLKVLLR